MTTAMHGSKVEVTDASGTAPRDTANVADPAAPGASARRRRSRREPPQVGSQVFLMLLTVAFLAPVAWAVVSAFKPAVEIIRDPLGLDPSQFTVDNFVAMFGDVPLASGFLNTAIVLVLKGSITMFFAPLAGYAFAKYDFPGKSLLFGTVLLTLMLPTIVLIIPLLLEMKDFVWAVVVTTSDTMQTLQVVLSTMAQNISGNTIGADYATITGELLAASSVALVPLLIIFIVLQKHFINGILAGS